jgi:multicomponent K+:H+ antiporter subunit F
MLAVVLTVTLLGLGLSLALCLYRLLIGPAVVDRILALDTMSTNVLALLIVLSIRWQTAVYLESALVLALMAFVATVALAKYLMRGRIIE